VKSGRGFWGRKNRPSTVRSKAAAALRPFLRFVGPQNAALCPRQASPCTVYRLLTRLCGIVTIPALDVVRIETKQK
jgi:hypothetical protein